MAHVDEIKADIAGHGREALLLNMQRGRRRQSRHVLAALRTRFDAQAKETGRNPYVRVLLHSLAFGTLKPFLAATPDGAISRKNMEMTLDVMANSLVYWAQDLWRGGLLGDGSKVYAMTSEGSTRVIADYGAVSAAKTALESHCRQLAMEFASCGTGVTVNAIRAGVTDDAGPDADPGARRAHRARHAANPHGRMTTVDDVAQAIVALSRRGHALDHRQRHRRRRRRARLGLSGPLRGRMTRTPGSR